VQTSVGEARTPVGLKLIRNVPVTNAVASGACGLLLLALPDVVSELTGIASRTALAETGAARTEADRSARTRGRNGSLPAERRLSG